ncbi:MAG: hypothetical protein L6R41_008104 [Letrouitia leprolyta]|nr:MAG: hypothetical protein L6R41_008104 [Letrouitia leprolyta]
MEAVFSGTYKTLLPVGTAPTVLIILNLLAFFAILLTVAYLLYKKVIRHHLGSRILGTFLRWVVFANLSLMMGREMFLPVGDGDGEGEEDDEGDNESVSSLLSGLRSPVIEREENGGNGEGDVDMGM